jgi:large conductance mechanosensitive channel
MRQLRAFLAERSVLEITIAVAVALIGIDLLGSIVAMVVDAIPRSGSLAVSLGRHELAYGAALIQLVTFVLVLATARWILVRTGTFTWADDDLRKCPHCLSEIPTAASVCEFCTRDVAPAEAV